MQLTELKKMPVEQLIELGEECGIENASRAKRQDIVFGILKSKAKSGEDIEGEGDNIRAKINFKASGEKKILLKFAKLKIIK